MQLGTPQEVYQEPRTEFVADFLGVANLLEVECLPGSGATRTVRYGDFTLEAQAPAGDGPTGRRAVIRPECVEVQEPGLTGANRLPGMVDGTVFLGSTTQVMIRLPHGGVLQSLVTNSARRDSPATGEAVTVHLPQESLRVLVAADRGSADAGAQP
jgi:spermidine/putrescine transport system ATP-binding protein